MTPGKTVAIVSVGGEFPDSPTLDRYWQNIVSNVDTARTPPADRWLLPPEQVYAPQMGAPDRVYSQKACFLAPESDSDPIPGSAIDPAYLAALDPMFRLLLRVGRQTLAATNLDDRIKARAGVIIGNLALPSEKSSALARYLLGQAFLESLDNSSLNLPEDPVAPDNRYVAGLPAALLGQAFGFQGSCYSIDAACASSLYAIKLAVDELLSGQTDLMLAGGLSRPDSLYTQMGFSQLRALSPSGTCSPFATTADGLVVGEGCGLVLLKRTEDAVRDGDDILAVIRGIGLSNDLAGNLLAPASEGQLRAMRAAYKQAGWKAHQVDLIECHATGTPVGDAVEFESLRQLWGKATWHPGQCVIGSVKANIGHLLTAAGSAALIKVLLAMKHRLLPPMTNFSSAAAGIELDDSPFRILQQAARWERRSPEQPRRAAVSAFGFGGINAHLLLEEWRPQAASKQRSLTSHPSFNKKLEPVAIVGMGTQFGSWPDLDAFSRRIFADPAQPHPHPPNHWWGVETSQWLQQQGMTSESFQGHYLAAVSAVPGEFRIPPLELAEMLPRQLLMLQVAAAALDDAGLKESDHLFTGVFIGCGLDLNATNFSFRWAMRKYAEGWARQLGLDLSPAALDSWVQQLRESCGPALTANRTMGALGSVVASRIAKDNQIGGPCFTLSNEENSGLRALEVGVKALLEGSINRALVGAVDLPGDVRNLIGREQAKESTAPVQQLPFVHQVKDHVIGEGAAALVLKRLADAKQDGDRIYAVIKGIGTAQSAFPEPAAVPVARSLSLARACATARVESASIGYLETEDRVSGDLDGRAQSPMPISNNRENIGYSGGAAGLAGVVKSALSLSRRILPASSFAARSNGAQDVTPAQYWLTDRGKHRRSLIAATGGDGSCSHILLEEAPETKTAAAGLLSAPPAGLTEALFVMEGNDSDALLATVDRLDHFAQQNPDLDIERLAAAWLEHQSLNPELERACALIVDTRAEFNDYLAAARRRISSQRRPESSQQKFMNEDPRLRERLFYSSAPLARQGKVAFMFPGSGNHYAGMGRELFIHWPQVLRHQETTSDQLASQYQPQDFWVNSLSQSIQQDHNALVISHVALCTAISDLLRQFGVEPRMVCGYSLGESAGLFATRAWRDRDGMLLRLRQSSLFTRDLAGECRAARRVWELPAGEQVDWLLGMVNLPEGQIRQALRGRKRIYLLIVNTYRETVIGGQRQQVEQLVADLGCHFIPLEGVTTVHCEVVKAVADAYRELHLFPTQAPSGIDFYSCARAA
jgi:acyl transferase domain-containing protein